MAHNDDGDLSAVGRMKQRAEDREVVGNTADVISRKNFSTSRARSKGCAMSPLVTVPTGCRRYSNHETAPKLPPPP